MDPKQRILRIEEDFFVKRLVLIVRDLGWRAFPERRRIVDRGRRNLFLLFVCLLFRFFFDLFKVDRPSHKAKVFVENAAQCKAVKLGFGVII